MGSPLTPLKETANAMPRSPPPAESKRSPKQSPKHSPPQKKDKKEKTKKEMSPPQLRERRERSPSPPPTHDGSYTDTFDTGGSKTDDNIPSLQEEAKKSANKQGMPKIQFRIVASTLLRHNTNILAWYEN